MALQCWLLAQEGPLSGTTFHFPFLLSSLGELMGLNPSHIWPSLPARPRSSLIVVKTMSVSLTCSFKSLGKKPLALAALHP